ncbi:hypothetical protein ATJ97_1740 [Georgenia soli]|uniref:Fido domain-containing protein n=1 Tax=Georgenia soli TaxID=638953 RepID=A0A2A9ELV0_9MICO|nr:cell filamentation protein Fic [Georgenia soli]PFG39242.1 hypothetical protein ATJ97_1740 [Georgenia soli]
MSTDVAAALDSLAHLDGVAEAADRAREATTRLRWHEGLRRRWREARAEAAVRSAVATVAPEGVRADAARLRGLVAAGETAQPAGAGASAGGAEEALVLAAWRAQVHVGQMLGELGGRGRPPLVPSGELLAGLHRDLTAHLAGAGVLPPDAVGRPRTVDQPREGGPLDPPATLRGGASATPAPVGAELRARTAAVLAVLAADDTPALVRVGVVHGEIATLRPFVTANGLLARAVARLLAVRSGLEPTGVAVLDAHAAARPGAYREALAAYAGGTPAGVAHWLRFQAESVVTGAEEGARVATAVRAGRVDL